MKTVTFDRWLRAQKDRRPSIVGDFARDVVVVRDWPTLAIADLPRYVTYLDRKCAAPCAYVALMTAFEEWSLGRGEPTLKELAR
jgi:hypothetical protein